MAKDEADKSGLANPYEAADREIAGFIARQAGTIAWSVHRPGEYDIDFEEASDDPDKDKKQRGSRHPFTRQRIIIGNEAHEHLYEALRRKGLPANEPIYNPKTGKFDLRPDGLIDNGKPLELKPDTESGRTAGQRQIDRYNQATGKRGRVIYYSPDGSYHGWRGGLGGPLRIGPGAESAGSPNAAFGPIRSPASAPAPIQPRVATTVPLPRSNGVGVGGSLYPKVRPPFYLRRMWEMLE